MKTIEIIFVITLASIMVITSGCDDTVTDFGFDGRISGMITDPSGNRVSGDVTTSTLIVYALGQYDKEPMEIRVKGDGTYANTHLYPQVYTLWVEGPVISAEEVQVDLTGDAVVHDFIVRPFLTIAPPELVGSPSSEQVDIRYKIAEEDGQTASVRRVYASTSSWPSQSTGSGPYWHTVTSDLSENEGTVSITGLKPATRYFIRVAARAEGTDKWNLSDQVVVTTR